MLIPEWLYLLLLTSGITVIAVLLYLRRQWLRFLQVFNSIQQLNEAVERDLINFLDGLCDSLAQLSVCGLHWQLQWFGQTIKRDLGVSSEYAHHFELTESEAQLKLTFYVTSARWEKAFYFELLRQQLYALCALDLALKMRQVTSFEQAVARYQLFLAHDLKNLAQMVVLWQKQVQDTPTEDAINALKRWQSVAPLIADRADLLAKRLSAPSDKPLNATPDLVTVDILHLIDRLKRWADVHGVKLKQTGEVANLSVRLEWEALDDAAFQLMRNYQQHVDLSKPVILSINQDSDALVLRFCHPQQVDESTFKRMQEPLWTSSENGVGLGLWQMGQMLQRMKGRFSLHYVNEASVCFVWQLSIGEIE